MEKGHYNTQDIELMMLTDKSKSSSRLKELIAFIKLNNYKTVGIASCLSVYKYAQNLKILLEKEDIKIHTVHCKESKLDASEISNFLKGPSCDPVSQAEYLNSKNTELNINFGLCLGHGILFQKYSNAPTTTLLVKDACNKHNIMENFI